MKTKNIFIGIIFLLSLGAWQTRAQSRIKRSLDPPSSQTSKSKSISTTGSKAGKSSGGSNSSSTSLSDSTKKSNGTSSGTTNSGTTNQNSNVIYLNVTKRKSDGKTSAVYGTTVGTKNGRRHVSGNGPNKQGKGHIVKNPDGTTEFHRTMNGTVKIDKKNGKNGKKQ